MTAKARRAPFCRGEEAPDPAREQSNAVEKALVYLTGRDYSSGELYEKLCRTFSEQASAAAVAEMQKRGYQDDARFAMHRARWLAQKQKSPREIRAVLREKGVDSAVIENALDALEDYDETAACRTLIEKHYQSKLRAGRADLVTASLLRRGFPYSAVKAALDALK